MTDIGDLNVILAGTQYESAIPCIQATFEAAGIKTINDLDNAPRKLTFCVCDFSTYPLLSAIRERTLNPPPQPAKAAPVAKKPKEPEAEKAEVEEKAPPPPATPDPQVKEDQETKE